jgi:hypothetical protein
MVDFKVSTVLFIFAEPEKGTSFRGWKKTLLVGGVAVPSAAITRVLCHKSSQNESCFRPPGFALSFGFSVVQNNVQLRFSFVHSMNLGQLQQKPEKTLNSISATRTASLAVVYRSTLMGAVRPKR